MPTFNKGISFSTLDKLSFNEAKHSGLSIQPMNWIFYNKLFKWVSLIVQIAHIL